MCHFSAQEIGVRVMLVSGELDGLIIRRQALGPKHFPSLIKLLVAVL